MSVRAHPQARVAATAALLIAGLLAWTGSAAADADGGGGIWFTDVQEASGASGFAVDVANDGTVMVAGRYSGPTYFPTGRPAPDDSIALTGTGSFVAAMHSDNATFAWAAPIPDGVSSINYLGWGGALAFTDDDTPIVVGYVSGTVYFPTGRPAPDDSIAIDMQAGYGAFIAALNRDDSTFAWVATPRNGPSGSAYARSVVATGNGTPIVTGFITCGICGPPYFVHTVSFPTGRPAPDDSVTLISQDSSQDGFVAALNPDDTTFDWALRIGGASVSTSNISVALTSDDTPIIAGSFSGLATQPGTAYFPTGRPAPDDSIALTWTGPGGSPTARDGFIAAMNPDDSTFAWATRVGTFSSGYRVEPQAVAVTGDDTVIMAGQFDGTASFPTGRAAPDDSIILTTTSGRPESYEGFVAAMNPDDSAFAWAVSISAGSPNDAIRVASVAVTGDDTTVVTGSFGGTAYFPTGRPAPDDSIAVTARGSADVFVAALNPGSPNFAWAVTAGGTGYGSGGTIAVTHDDTPVVTAQFGSGPIDFPTGPDDSIAVASPLLAWLGPAIAAPPQPTPTPSPAAAPPSAPQGVVARGGSASGTITWTAPADSGAFAITSYQATASPGGRSCLTSSPPFICTISGLSNGTTYTARVRALSGAGWGPWSTDSDAFTPQAPASPALSISGTRGQVGGRSGVVVSGTSVGLGSDAILRPWFRFPGQASYIRGEASILVSADGTFAWQRRTSKTMYVVVKSDESSVASNRIVVPAR